MMGTANLITDSQAAAILQLTPRQVAKLARRGELPTVRLPGNEIRFDPDDIRLWIERHKVPPGEHGIAVEAQHFTQARLTMTPLDLAKLFHETYERLAPEFGRQTRSETREFNPESPNGRLMVAICGEILQRLNHAESVNIGTPPRDPLADYVDDALIRALRDRGYEVLDPHE